MGFHVKQRPAPSWAPVVFFGIILAYFVVLTIAMRIAIGQPLGWLPWW